jgi:hypothetical protein
VSAIRYPLSAADQVKEVTVRVREMRGQAAGGSLGMRSHSRGTMALERRIMSPRGWRLPVASTASMEPL